MLCLACLKGPPNGRRSYSMSHRFIRISCVAVALFAAACRTGAPGQPPATAVSAAAAPIVQPGAPGEASHPISAAKAADLSKVSFTPADVKFMQGMIGHHAQAVEMVALVPSRTNWDDMKKLALRIEVSQVDEIKMMEEWLRARRQDVPGPHAMHMHGATLMPGMLTPEEMDRLAAARGAEFDRRFLEGMIKHHAGALIMVEDLFASPGAGQESEMFAFASDVEADQKMEIQRMALMLKELER
jgi:uncharacterized protein (DUF305 family)